MRDLLSEQFAFAERSVGCAKIVELSYCSIGLLRVESMRNFIFWPNAQNVSVAWQSRSLALSPRRVPHYIVQAKFTARMESAQSGSVMTLLGTGGSRVRMPHRALGPARKQARGPRAHI